MVSSNSNVDPRSTAGVDFAMTRPLRAIFAERRFAPDSSTEIPRDQKHPSVASAGQAHEHTGQHANESSHYSV